MVNMTTILPNANSFGRIIIKRLTAISKMMGDSDDNIVGVVSVFASLMTWLHRGIYGNKN